MGTQVEIILPVSNNNTANLDELLEYIKSESKRYETKFSSYNPDSIISNINSSDSLHIDNETKILLTKAMYISKISNGAFDFTITPLLELWGFYSDNKSAQVPSQEEINQIKKHIGYRNITLFADSNLVVKEHEFVRIDLAGIAKGFLVDIIVSILKDNNIDNALINAGGDIYCLGKGADGGFWNIGIQHPRLKNTVIGKLSLSNKAVVTSGDYRKFFLIGNKRYSHIIDPFSGYPIKNKVLGATVIADDTAMADGLATALMVLGKEKGLRLINSLDDIETIIITEDDNESTIALSDGFKQGICKFIKQQ